MNPNLIVIVPTEQPKSRWGLREEERTSSTSAAPSTSWSRSDSQIDIEDLIGRIEKGTITESFISQVELSDPTEEPIFQTKGKHASFKEPRYQTKDKHASFKEPRYQTKDKHASFKEPIYQTKGKHASFKEPIYQTKGKHASLKEPIYQTKGKHASFKEPIFQTKDKHASFKEPIYQTKGKHASFKEPIYQTKDKHASFKEPIYQTKGKHASFKEPIYQTKGKYASFKEPIFQTEDKHASFKEPIVQTKGKHVSFNSSKPSTSHAASSSQWTDPIDFAEQSKLSSKTTRKEGVKSSTSQNLDCVDMEVDEGTNIDQFNKWQKFSPFYLDGPRINDVANDKKVKQSGEKQNENDDVGSRIDNLDDGENKNTKVNVDEINDRKTDGKLNEIEKEKICGETVNINVESDMVIDDGGLGIKKDEAMAEDECEKLNNLNGIGLDDGGLGIKKDEAMAEDECEKLNNLNEIDDGSLGIMKDEVMTEDKCEKFNNLNGIGLDDGGLGIKKDEAMAEGEGEKLNLNEVDDGGLRFKKDEAMAEGEGEKLNLNEVDDGGLQFKKDEAMAEGEGEKLNDLKEVVKEDRDTVGNVADADSDFSDSEVDALLEKGFNAVNGKPKEDESEEPPLKKARSEITDCSIEENAEDAYTKTEKIILLQKTKNHFEVLPDGWVEVTHDSGMPLYLHKQSRVCTLSKPYFLGDGSARKHTMPLSAVPCFEYLKAQEKQAEATEESVEKNGIQLPKARVETAEENEKSRQLTPVQLREYCQKRFEFQTIEVLRFKSWLERRKYYEKNKRAENQPRPTLPQNTKLIMCPVKQGGREWFMNPVGKSHVCILHEYVQRALKDQPVYTYKELENTAMPYQAVISIGGVQYGTGMGSSKKQAKHDAAKETLEILIPEMKNTTDAEKAPEAGRPTSSTREKPDLSFFDGIKITDPRVTEFCQKTTEPLPHTILMTCIQRNFGLNDVDVNCETQHVRHGKIQFTMNVGAHTVSVICRNKREGKQKAAQGVLQQLHPHVTSWGSLLRLYGNSSVKSVKEKKQEEQQITLLQGKGESHGPNYAILDKLKAQMAALRPFVRSIPPGKFSEGVSSASSSTQTGPGQGTSRDGEGTSRDGQGTSRYGQGTSRDGQGTSRDGQGTSRDGQGTSRDGQGTSRDGQGTSRDGQGTSRDGQGTSHDNQGTSRDGQGTSRDGQGTSRDGPGTSRDGQGTSRDAMNENASKQ